MTKKKQKKLLIWQKKGIKKQIRFSYKKNFDPLFKSNFISKFLNTFIIHGQKKTLVWQLYRNLLILFKSKSFLFHYSLYYFFRRNQLPFLIKPFYYRGLRGKKNINYVIQQKNFLYQFVLFLNFRKAINKRMELVFFLRFIGEYFDFLFNKTGVSYTVLSDMLIQLNLARRKLAEIAEKEKLKWEKEIRKRHLNKKPRVRYRWFFFNSLQQKKLYYKLLKR